MDRWPYWPPELADAPQNFKLTKYELEPLEDDRVTVAVEVCGVCGSVSRYEAHVGYNADHTVSSLRPLLCDFDTSYRAFRLVIVILTLIPSQHVPYLTTVLIDPPATHISENPHFLWSPRAFAASFRSVHVPSVCVQDHHTISGGWGPFATKFVVTGHEVVGRVVEVGAKVTQFKVGQRVGVGAQVGSCHECKACKSGLGEWCPRQYPSDRPSTLGSRT